MLTFVKHLQQMVWYFRSLLISQIHYFAFFDGQSSSLSAAACRLLAFGLGLFVDLVSL